VIGSGDVNATGTITADADAPTGLRVTVQMENRYGAPYGSAVTTSTRAALLKGQSVQFVAVVPTLTTSAIASDMCDVGWATTPPA
jgi:hypothetical protein